MTPVEPIRKPKDGSDKSGKPGKPPAAPDVVVRPVARKAHVRKRHRFLFFSLFGLLVLPVMLTIIYLYVFAEDQYASSVAFTIRQEETGSASEIMGGLSALMGGANTGNTDVLFEFIQSQEIVERVAQHVDLRTHYAQFWTSDPVFSIWPTATIEDLLWFWRRVVRITYDRNSGLIDVQVRARSPEMAQRIAQAIVLESELMINALNEAARRDSMANAERDLQEAMTRLRAAREEMAEFRARTQIVDPQADIQGRMGVLNNLQQQLAEALVEHDLLLQITNESDPRIRQAQRRIEVIRERIAQERVTFATENVTVLETDYPRLLAQFEGLQMDVQFAQQTYTAALTALDAARSNAARQGFFLATFVRPTLAQRAEYPQRLLLVMLTTMFLLLGWAIFALIYYSIRDRN
ncbi:MAG: sugar transporter [Pararhodobacter sp.]|nr:sugar transporter [Pararhodobacter sp.]